MKITKSLLAPYGSMKYARLATKVGVDPKGLLAPYGSMKFAQLATKVGTPPKSKDEAEQQEASTPANKVGE
jgi:hypothetical protein